MLADPVIMQLAVARGFMSDGVDAVRSDGGLVRIRPATATDAPGLRDLYGRASDRSLYMRFFSYGRDNADKYAAGLARQNDGDHFALVASVRGEIVGEAAFDRVSADSAEFSVIVADDRHVEGIGTLLLEHLAGVARHLGYRRFVGDVLMENGAMLDVLHNLGFAPASTTEFGVVHFEFPLDASARFVHAIDERDRAADAESLRALLAPRSIAVIGASERPGVVGREVLANILAAGFRGQVFAVNPKHASVLGVECVPSPIDLPEAPDLVIVAVPAPAVPDVVRQSGERGARTVLLLSAGFGELGERGVALQQKTLQLARDYGMRVVGPNCVGIVNTDPLVRLNATFGRVPAMPGSLGLLSQSGAFGLGFVECAQRAGLGISQFVSVGNKADVSGNDMLLFWENDPNTAVIGMYLESIKDAARFVHIARRVARRKPILALKSGRTEAGQRAGQSHTAAAASSEVAIDALFRAAGVIRLATTQEFVDAARVLADVPAPKGPRLVIVGNSGGPGILAADAAVTAGLTVPELDERTRHAIAAAVPSAASTQNPVDLGAGVTADELRRAIEIVASSDAADAILTIYTEVAVSDPADVRAAVATAARGTRLPVVSVEVGGEETRIPLGHRRALPVFALPEAAASAMGVAHRYGRIRSERTRHTRSSAPRRAIARRAVASKLARGGGWLAPDEIATVLRAYGIPACPQRLVSNAAEAATAAAHLGYPVVAKVTGVDVHKSDVGGVRVGIASQDELTTALDELAAICPGPILLQPMIGGGGREFIVGAVRDVVGPLVMAGAGGTLA
ncbi:MAG TPA: GNAT family N-acetyltransferase, partial [Jatrophihabitantaceae bacterium]|nr:GNAT family N-acetyltransferase [Jatrophihabitantaceae bacterium]